MQQLLEALKHMSRSGGGCSLSSSIKDVIGRPLNVEGEPEGPDAAVHETGNGVGVGVGGRDDAAASAHTRRASDLRHDIREVIWSELLDLEEVLSYRRHHRQHPVHT
jgi:hypothetical protein